MDDVEDFLEHHGVKGMKWGVRHDPKTRRRISSDHRKTAEIRKHRPHELSNKQLQNANQRAVLEQNFRRLNPSTAQQGAAMVKGFLAAAATGVTVFNLINSPAGKALIQAGKNFIKK